MNDADIDRLCGMVLRGTSLPVACDLLDIDLRMLLDEAADDPHLLTDLFSAMINRARMRQQVIDRK